MLFSKRVWILIALAFAAKTLVTPLIPGASPDFTSWVQLSQDVSGQIQAGIVPQLGRYGAYTFMGVLLVPFFLAWSALPVAHPAYVVGLLTQPLSIEQYSLIFMMKLPINLCDFFTGLMIAVISRKFNPNVATKAFWLWYLNPYTTLMMEYYGTFDIVPTLILLGASYLGLQRKWVGFSAFHWKYAEGFSTVRISFLLPLCFQAVEKGNCRISHLVCHTDRARSRGASRCYRVSNRRYWCTVQFACQPALVAYLHRISIEYVRQSNSVPVSY